MPDIRIEFHGGNLMRLVGLTPAGNNWLDENIQADPWAKFGGICADPNHFHPIFNGMRDAGLRVDIDRKAS